LGQTDAQILHSRRGQTDYVSKNLEARIWTRISKQEPVTKPLSYVHGYVRTYVHANLLPSISCLLLACEGDLEDVLALALFVFLVAFAMRNESHPPVEAHTAQRALEGLGQWLRLGRTYARTYNLRPARTYVRTNGYVCTYVRTMFRYIRTYVRIEASASTKTGHKLRIPDYPAYVDVGADGAYVSPIGQGSYMFPLSCLGMVTHAETMLSPSSVDASIHHMA